MLDVIDSCGANSKSVGPEVSVTTPGMRVSHEGKSVEYVLSGELTYWYAIRATHHRAKQVFDSVCSLDYPKDSFEPYLPLIKKVVYSNEDFQNPTKAFLDEPLDSGLLFLRTSYEIFKEVLALNIPGLTPYYNHFATNEFGKNELLVVPEIQMQSFRKIVESGVEGIIVDQNDAPKFLKGDDVVVTGGPFEGVEGKVLRFRSKRRVFVELPNLGIFGTGFVPVQWLRKISRN